MSGVYSAQHHIFRRHIVGLDPWPRSKGIYMSADLLFCFCGIDRGLMEDRESH